MQATANQLSFDPEKHEYRLDGVRLPSVTECLKAGGLIESDWYTEAARVRGKAVHAACHYHDEKDLNESMLDERILPYLSAWRKFLKESGFKITIIEKSYAHFCFQYAGTPDRIGYLNDKLTVLDIKTGAIQPWAALQTAAYAELYMEQDGHAGIELERCALRLSDDGTYSLKMFKDFGDFPMFANALAIYKWRLNNGLTKYEPGE